MSISSGSIKKFIASRISRLYPAYWFSVLFTSFFIFTLGFNYYDIELKQILLNLSMIHEMFGVKSVDGVYWSLLVELRFYFLIFIFLVINQFKKLDIDYFILSWLSISILFFLEFDLFSISWLKYLLIHDWASYFISGMIFYKIYEKGYSVKYTLMLVLSLTLSLNYSTIYTDFLTNLFDYNFNKYISMLIIIFFYLLIFIISLGGLKILNKKSLLKLGLLTYPLYLVHQNFGFILINNFIDINYKYIFIIGLIILMIFISWLINVLIEQKISPLLKKYSETIFKFLP
tara:strand:+ start:6 stop:869 length:864 start_codon:yes stop_codon:yes gene_type:complete